MEIKRVWSIYFSATGTTKKIVTAISREICRVSGAVPSGLTSAEPVYSEWDFTLPGGRKNFPSLGEGDLVVFGVPTYAGRVPNVLLKYLDTVAGGGALAACVVTFGNRAYDNSLIELRNILEEHGFHTVAAGGFSCEHSFSYELGAGRPDSEDIQAAQIFGRNIWQKISALTEIPEPIQVDGDPEAGYYKPQDRNGVFIDIRKVTPLTSEKCVGCGLCADVCPMGSIDSADVSKLKGICIKCGACIKKCPVGAKYYDDPGYLYHKTELEEMYKRRGENRVFI